LPYKAGNPRGRPAFMPNLAWWPIRPPPRQNQPLGADSTQLISLQQGRYGPSLPLMCRVRCTCKGSHNFKCRVKPQDGCFMEIRDLK